MTNGGGAGVKMSEREMDKMLDEVFRKVFGEKW